MTISHIIAIAVALSTDAFAVSIAAGACLKSVEARQFFRLSWHFGLFQAMMPVIGWYAGLTIREMIESFGHWVAFGLLFYVGSSMLMDALSKKDKKCRKADPTKGLNMVMLSLATSIDALAVGLSLSILKLSVWEPAFIIGITAGLFTILGLYIGSKAIKIKLLKKCAEIFGAAVLYIVGINILYQNGVFA